MGELADWLRDSGFGGIDQLALSSGVPAWFLDRMDRHAVTADQPIIDHLAAYVPDITAMVATPDDGDTGLPLVEAKRSWRQRVGRTHTRLEVPADQLRVGDLLPVGEPPTWVRVHEVRPARRHRPAQEHHGDGSITCWGGGGMVEFTVPLATGGVHTVRVRPGTLLMVARPKTDDDGDDVEMEGEDG